MRVTFFSNFLNHYQLSLSREFLNCLGNDYRFVATEPLHEEQKKLGFHNMVSVYPWVVEAYVSETNKNEALRLGRESDVVIIGSAPDIFISDRLSDGKLTFRFCERLFKKGKHVLFNPKAWYFLYKHHIKFKNDNLHMLCASAYAAADFKSIGAYPDKLYTWGYFTDALPGKVHAISPRDDKKIKLLWAGRLIEWKHPEQALYLAQKLKHAGICFSLDIIGTGAQEAVLRQMIDTMDLHDLVTMLGPMSPESVQLHMKNADIYLFTSDYNEGWGVVLNEAMSCACAVVASHAAGSVPVLVEHKKNGMIYRSGDIDSLYKCVLYLISNPDERERMAAAAYEKIADEWNSRNAVYRLLVLSEKLMKKGNADFSEGICSKAQIISNRSIENKSKYFTDNSV